MTSPPPDGTAPARVPRLADLILGGPRSLTRDEVAEQLGVDVVVARRLWRAMGFPDVGDAVAFGAPDVAAAADLLSVVDGGDLDLDTAVEVVRSLGRTTARLAEWQADVIGRRLLDDGIVPTGRPPDDAERAEIRAAVARLLPVGERLLAYAWRRQLVAALDRLDLERGPADPPDALSVVFADVVGFTRLSRRLGPADLAALVEAFETVSADVVAAVGARLVKTLGDEVMFVADSPAVAVEAALGMLAAHDDLHAYASAAGDAGPAETVELRIGIATGPVISRLGDVFGSTVNLASRLTTLAEPGSVLADVATVAGLLADDPDAYAVTPVGPHPVHGLGSVSAFAIAPRQVRPGPPV